MRNRVLNIRVVRVICWLHLGNAVAHVFIIGSHPTQLSGAWVSREFIMMFAPALVVHLRCVSVLLFVVVASWSAMSSSNQSMCFWSIHRTRSIVWQGERDTSRLQTLISTWNSTVELHFAPVNTNCRGKRGFHPETGFPRQFPDTSTETFLVPIPSLVTAHCCAEPGGCSCDSTVSDRCSGQ